MANARNVPSTDDEAGLGAPGYRNYLVYSDESGIHGADYYGFGTLWMPWERRGDFAALVATLRRKHAYEFEAKWNKVSRSNVAFYLDLLDEFFKRNWLMFHCLLVRKGYVDLALHRNDLDVARRKHFAMLVKMKVKYFCANSSNKAYHFRIDPFPSRYPKADEVAFKIAAAQLKNEMKLSPLKTLLTRDSKTTAGIQVADFLLGAAMADWQQDATAQGKERIRSALAAYLGWPDLRSDTAKTEWKFNIWHFWNPKSPLPREVKTRDVALRYRTPVFRPKGS